jgi:hypothetical protein
MRRFLAFLLLAPIAVAVTWAVAYVFTRGVDVTIINTGPAPLSDVVVHVVGNRGSDHRIGAIPVGEARSVRLPEKRTSSFRSWTPAVARTD